MRFTLFTKLVYFFLFSVLFLGVLCNSIFALHAPIPVMNTLPRWNHGYGFQVRYLFEIDQTEKPISSHLFSLDYVVSFTKEWRIFFQIPYSLVYESNSIKYHGIDGALLGGAFKYYFNLYKIAASIGFAPNIQFPVLIEGEPLHTTIRLPFISDVETFYWLCLSQAWFGFSIHPNANITSLEVSSSVSVGIHIWHSDYLNAGAWLSIGFEWSSHFYQNKLRGEEHDLTLLLPIIRFYKNATLFHLEFPIGWRFRRNEQAILETDFEIGARVSVGFASLY